MNGDRVLVALGKATMVAVTGSVRFRPKTTAASRQVQSELPALIHSQLVSIPLKPHDASRDCGVKLHVV